PVADAAVRDLVRPAVEPHRPHRGHRLDAGDVDRVQLLDPGDDVLQLAREGIELRFRHAGAGQRGDFQHGRAVDGHGVRPFASGFAGVVREGALNSRPGPLLARGLAKDAANDKSLRARPLYARGSGWRAASRLRMMRPPYSRGSGWRAASRAR